MEISEVDDVYKSISAAKRLVVLIPDSELDETILGRQVWNLALPGQKSVVLLSAAQNLDEELRAIHRLTQIVAVANDPRFHIESIVRFQSGWIRAIKSIYKPGDLILCFESHKIPFRIFWHQSIQSFIEDHLKIPVNTFPKTIEPALIITGHRITVRENKGI